jgi:hypothetical protein
MFRSCAIETNGSGIPRRSGEPGCTAQLDRHRFFFVRLLPLVSMLRFACRFCACLGTEGERKWWKKMGPRRILVLFFLW